MRISWHKQHASAIFLALLLLLSVVLLLGGFSLQAKTSPMSKTAGNLLVQLSGAALATSIATAFLGFSDVRDSLAATLARLFSEGSVVKLLSSDVRDVIHKEIIMSRLAGTAREIEPSLLEHLTGITNACLGAPHIQNYNIRDILVQHPARPDLLAREVAVSFRISARHLTDPMTPLPYLFLYQIPIPDGDEIDERDFLLEFEATLGNERFTREDVGVRKKNKGGVDFLRFIFETSVPIGHELDAYINYKAAAVKHDTFAVYRARYPTRGFNVTLNDSGGQDYDGVWSKATKPLEKGFPGRKELRILPNGISAVTNDWVLPGEGIAFSWMREPAEQNNLHNHNLERVRKRASSA